MLLPLLLQQRLRNHFLSFLYDTELKYAVLLQEYIYIFFVEILL